MALSCDYDSLYKNLLSLYEEENPTTPDEVPLETPSVDDYHLSPEQAMVLTIIHKRLDFLATTYKKFKKTITKDTPFESALQYYTDTVHTLMILKKVKTYKNYMHIANLVFEQLGEYMGLEVEGFSKHQRGYLKHFEEDLHKIAKKNTELDPIPTKVPEKDTTPPELNLVKNSLVSMALFGAGQYAEAESKIPVVGGAFMGIVNDIVRSVVYSKKTASYPEEHQEKHPTGVNVLHDLPLSDNDISTKVKGLLPIILSYCLGKSKDGARKGTHGVDHELDRLIEGLIIDAD